MKICAKFSSRNFYGVVVGVTKEKKGDVLALFSDLDFHSLPPESYSIPVSVLTPSPATQRPVPVLEQPQIKKP